MLSSQLPLALPVDPVVLYSIAGAWSYQPKQDFKIMPHPGSNASDKGNKASIRMIRQKFDHCQILRWQEAYLFIP